MGIRVEISERVTLELQRESFILYVAGEEEVEYGYENAAEFAAALDRVLRSDRFRDWLSQRLRNLSAHSKKESDRE